MKKSQCKRKLSLAQAILQKFQLNNRWVMDVSKTVKQAVGNHTDLIGKYGDAFDMVSRDYTEFKTILEKESNLNIHLFNQDMSALFGKMGRGIGVGGKDGQIPYKGSELILEPALLKEYIMSGTIKQALDITVANRIQDEGMAYFGKFLYKDGKINEKRVDELVGYITNTFTPIGEHGYDLDNIFLYMNQGDILDGVLGEIRQSYKIDIASAIDVEERTTVKNFTDATDVFVGNVRAEMAIQGIEPTPDQLKTFIKDFTGEALYKDSKMKGVINFSNSLRGIYTSLKYFAAPFTAPLMLAQAFAVGGMNIVARTTGLPVMFRGKAVDYFLEDLKVLKGENPFDKTIFEEMGDTWFGTFINKILPNPNAQAIVKGGWQTIFDMTTDNTVKRLAVATALSKEGFNFKNEAELLKMIQDGNISKEAINRINANALMFYTDFRTNSSSLFLSRNAFSRWYAVNALQGYVTNRASEVFRSVYNFGQAIRRGDINTFGDFFRYIEDPANAEFKWLIYTPLLATKYSFYADKMMNDDDTTENRVDRIKEYSMGINDFMSSWDATFIGRLFSGVLDYEGVYIDYVNSKGETGTIYGGIEAGIYGFMGALMSSLFKEMKTLNIVANPAKMLLAGESDMSVLIDQAGIELKKVAEGMGRFNLIPGIETYGLQKIPQVDDFFATILMNLDETNESLKTSSKLRKMEEIEKILTNPLKMADTIMYSNIVKFIMGDEVSETELKYSRLMQHTTDDTIMQNLYNGVFDRDIFNQMDSQDIYGMYTEITQLDLSKLKLSQEGVQKVLGGADIANMKINTFVKLLEDKLGIQNLNTLIDQWQPDAGNVGLQKIFALAENNIPGASRAILAYAANRLQDRYVEQMNLSKGVNPKSAKSEDTLTTEELAEIQKAVIQTTYPYMYIADKASWYSLIAERAKQIDPTVFGGRRTDGTVYADKNISKFINALGLMDMVAYSEAQKGNPDARYISSVYSMVGKYVQDPRARLGIMTNTYETIERLDVDPKMKATIKLGNALGNLDILDKALKDPVFVANNRDVLDNAIKTVFGTIDHINKTGMSTLLEELDDANGYISQNTKQPNWNGSASKQATSYGNSYPKKQYDNSNRESLDKVSAKIPQLFKNLPPDYKSGQNMRFPYDVNAKYSSPKPIEFNQYVKIYHETSKAAQTDTLVSGYVRHSSSDYIDKLKTTVKYNTPKWQTVKKYKIPKGKTMWRRAYLNYD